MYAIRSYYVGVVHPPRVGAAPHGDDPLGVGHLLVEAQDGRPHLLEGGAGDDRNNFV